MSEDKVEGVGQDTVQPEKAAKLPAWADAFGTADGTIQDHIQRIRRDPAAQAAAKAQRSGDRSGWLNQR